MPTNELLDTRQNNGLNHWRRELHIVVDVFVIIGLRNDMASNRRQAISWTNPDFFYRQEAKEQS